MDASSWRRLSRARAASPHSSGLDRLASSSSLSRGCVIGFTSAIRSLIALFWPSMMRCSSSFF